MGRPRKPRGRPKPGVRETFDGVTVEWAAEFKPRWPNEQRLLARIGVMGAQMIEERIRGGKDSDGDDLPDLTEHSGRRSGSNKAQARWWYTLAYDQRFAGVPGRTLQEARKNPPRRDGDYAIKVKRTGAAKGHHQLRRVWQTYGAAKEALGAKPKRDLSLTGAMWRSMQVKVTGGQKKRQIRIFFSGNDKQFKAPVYKDGEPVRTAKGKIQTRSLRHRDKARLAMYGKHTANGEAKGQQLFQLMRLSDDEIRELSEVYAKAVELFQ